MQGRWGGGEFLSPKKPWGCLIISVQCIYNMQLYGIHIHTIQVSSNTSFDTNGVFLLSKHYRLKDCWSETGRRMSYKVCGIQGVLWLSALLLNVFCECRLEYYSGRCLPEVNVHVWYTFCACLWDKIILGYDNIACV